MWWADQLLSNVIWRFFHYQSFSRNFFISYILFYLIRSFIVVEGFSNSCEITYLIITKINLYFQAENKKKNRYPDKLPYDHNRVILNALVNATNSDYINASTGKFIQEPTFSINLNFPAKKMSVFCHLKRKCRAAGTYFNMVRTVELWWA